MKAPRTVTQIHSDLTKARSDRDAAIANVQAFTEELRELAEKVNKILEDEGLTDEPAYHKPQQ